MDEGGNWVTNSLSSVTVEAQWQGWVGAVALHGEREAAVVLGVASFPLLSLSDTAAAVHLLFSAPSLAPVVSRRFDVTGPPLAMRIEWNAAGMLPPAQAGVVFPLQPVVVLLDRQRVDVRCACTVGAVSTTAAIAEHAEAVEVFGGHSVEVEEGRAVFTDLFLRAAGPSVRISFTFRALGTGEAFSAMSETFDVRAALPVELRILRDMDAHL